MEILNDKNITNPLITGAICLFMAIGIILIMRVLAKYHKPNYAGIKEPAYQFIATFVGSNEKLVTGHRYLIVVVYAADFEAFEIRCPEKGNHILEYRNTLEFLRNWDDINHG